MNKFLKVISVTGAVGLLAFLIRKTSQSKVPENPDNKSNRKINFFLKK